MLFHSFSCCICPTALASRCSPLVDRNFALIGDCTCSIEKSIKCFLGIFSYLDVTSVRAWTCASTISQFLDWSSMDKGLKYPSRNWVTSSQNDIPYPDDLPQEVHRWKTLTSIKEIGSKCTIEQAITHMQFYPNIRQLLLLLLALPVGSCSCERSFSALRRLKTWNRSTMTESRLCGLTMLHIHRNDDVGHIECVEVLERWDSSGHRKVALAFDKA
jgi:hypothetical protein